jgi:transcriptional regulator NrdR family protein
MKCSNCASRTNITNTYKHKDGVLRRRKCFECGAGFMTLETPYTMPERLKPEPKPKALFSKRDVAMINKIKTEIRRRNEDTNENKE